MHTANEIVKIIELTPGTPLVKKNFKLRLEEGKLTRDENAQSHFCVYFAGYDPEKRRVFIGHHKKSGLWLFNGGHIDKNELPTTSLVREIHEEWGHHITIPSLPAPSLLTITTIENPQKQPCRTHFDIWYFIPLQISSFNPSSDLLEKEFFLWGWKSYTEALECVVNKETVEALKKIRLLFSE